MFARNSFRTSISAVGRAYFRIAPTAMSTSVFQHQANGYRHQPVHIPSSSMRFDMPEVQELPSFSDKVYSSPSSLSQDFINAGAEASFLVTNLATVRAMHKQWLHELPMVRPFYAVKCNPDPCILRVLASLGCGFDCATQGEIDLVMNGLGKEHNFTPQDAFDSIVYAHPAKMEHMIKYAIGQNVGMTVFDGEDELYKMASISGISNMKALLRIATDDKSSVCRFSNKFGCQVSDAPRLLSIAKNLGIDVIGCSFHVGSGCGDATAYKTALEHCRQVFQHAEELGMPPFSVVDIGGGFPGDTSGYGGPHMPTFQELAAAIREGIANFCNGGWTNRSIDSIKFIAEPGRYFASASTSIACKVYARKGGNSDKQALYVDDGVYGSFNSVVYDHAKPIPQRIVKGNSEPVMPSESSPKIPTAVFGPTCDGLDEICNIEDTFMPRCEIGDWLLFENCGAYTHTASFFFNGYTHVPTKLYCYHENTTLP